MGLNSKAFLRLTRGNLAVAGIGLISVLALSHCGSGGSASAPVLNSLAITPGNPNLVAGGTQQFTATGSFSNGNTQDLTSSVGWTSSNTKVATINATGLATLIQAGSVTFSAASGSVSSSTPSLAVSPKLVSLSVSPPNTTIPLGVSQQLSAKGVFGDGSSQDLTSSVTWTSSSDAIATVSAAGLVKSLSTGMVTVTATKDSVTGKASATVGPAVSVSVTPATATVPVGQSLQFTASVKNTSDAAVTWSVDSVPGGNLTTGLISTSGLYRTPAKPGSHSVAATSQLDTTKSAQATIADQYGGIFTYHNDNGRTGQNLSETALTPANVNSTQFGKLLAYPVDGPIFGQPLYANSVTLPGQAVHNLVYVVTENDSVYAFDADGKESGPLWHVNFTNPSAGITTVAASAVSDDGFPPGASIGITSTPAIDPLAGTLYVVAYTNENGQYVYRLHALDLTDGSEKTGSPVVVQATVAGSGAENNGQGQIPFDSKMHLQRPGLLLLNGTLYIGFGSHADTSPWHGWLLAYDAATLQQTGAYNTTANDSGGAIWEGGCGPAADSAGNVYVVTGNGTFDGDTSGSDFGDSVLKLGSSLNLMDWFSPYDTDFLSDQDLDLGSGGVLLLPDQPGEHPHLLVTSGKQGRIFLIDRDNMGHFDAANDAQIVQELYYSLGSNFSTPSYWQANVYFAAWNDHLKMFSLSNGLLSVSPVSQSSTLFGYVGTTTSVSANGAANGIVWAVDWGVANAVLHAYDATNVANELYNSTQVASRDGLGPAAKFTVPTVANGKVYVGTATELDVLGLLGR